MTTFEKHQLIDTLSKLINILSIKTININTVLLNEQSPFALNHDFGNQLIFMGNLVREIALLLYPIHILESNTWLSAISLAWKIRNTVLSNINFKALESYFTCYLCCTLRTLRDRPKESFYRVVKIQVGDLSNKKEKIPTILVFTEEDKYGLYSNLLFKYFLAEGVVCGHDLFVASAKEHPDNILKVTKTHSFWQIKL